MKRLFILLFLSSQAFAAPLEWNEALTTQGAAQKIIINSGTMPDGTPVLFAKWSVRFFASYYEYGCSITRVSEFLAVAGPRDLWTAFNAPTPNGSLWKWNTFTGPPANVHAWCL